MTEFKPIKTIAGQILLYFYLLHRTKPVLLSDWMMSFNTYTKKISIEDRSNTEVIDSLIQISSNEMDIINALEYLSQKHFISTGGKGLDMSGNATFHSVKLTAGGIDIIENIEQGESEQKNFEINFNINVNNNMNIESLLKTEIGSLFKGSLI